MNAWLAEADLPPRPRLRTLWHNPWGYELLPAGRQWDAVVIAAPLTRLILEHLGLARQFVGPVLADSLTAQAYFFVPPDTRRTWAHPSPCLSRGSWIVVPASICATGQLRWLVTPDGSNRLTDPQHLADALEHAAQPSR